MTTAEVPPEWLRAAQDAYRAAFGPQELNLIAAALPVVIEAVRPLIEAQAGFTDPAAVCRTGYTTPHQLRDRA